MGVSDLVEFLRARLDEGEKKARGSIRLRRIFGERCPRCGLVIRGYGKGPGAEGYAMEIHHEDRAASDCGLTADEWITFASAGLTDRAQFDLADIDTKRQIIDLHSGDNDELCQSGNYVYEPCPTLRLLALPYADHPDYRDEWKLEVNAARP
jgi:Family of unknown function (DUF6221)